MSSRSVLALGGLAAAPAGLALATGAAAVHPCLPVTGAWAWAGVRLALLGPDAACPEGTLALAAAPAGAAATVVVAVALPTLLVHLGLLGGVAVLAGAVRSVVAAAVHRFVAALRRPVPAVVVVAGPAIPVAPGVPRPHLVQGRRRHPHRGPPRTSGPSLALAA